MDTRIAGIPCRIEVTEYSVQEPMGRIAESDWDCYGYVAIEFEVLDRRGRPAPWLEVKMTDADHVRICKEIEAHHAD